MATLMTDPSEIYESCLQLRKTTQPDVLDDLLEIRFIHVPTRKVLKRTRFFVTADDPTSAWIRSHPTFQRGCWPFGLMALHQWFWQIKFVEVEGKETIEGGIVDPKVGTTTIRAEFDDFEGEGWLVPLVNLANTHLLDQLRQFYKDAPTAFPTPQRISDVMAAEMKKFEEKHKALALEQTKRQRLIQVPTEKVRIFIDESGDIGFREVQDVYAFAAVIVPEGKHAKMVEELRGLLAKHWGKNAPREIHMSETPVGKKGAVCEDLARVVTDNDVRVLCFGMEKWPFIKHLFRCHAEARFTEELPLNLTWHDLTTDKDFFLQANFLALTVEELVSGLAIDFLVNGVTADFYHDRKYRVWMNEALGLGFKRGIGTAKKLAQDYFGLSIVPKITFAIADSESEPCLWLADWIANELRAWCDQQPFSNAFEKAKRNIRFVAFDEHGVKHSGKDIGGYGEETFPDLPREITRGNPATTN